MQVKQAGPLDDVARLATKRRASRPGPTTFLLAAALALLAGVQAAGTSLTGAATSMAACAAILVLGLPHGALDWELLREAAGRSRAQLARALLLYVAIAAAMLVGWLASSVLALALFLLAAIVHFAEDWSEDGRGRPSFPALAMGTALLAAPALTHRVEVRALFASLARTPRAEALADLLALAAPIALLLGVATLARLWRGGARDAALAGACSLAALLILPPLVGFALFFCLCHSPLHLRAALAERRDGRALASVAWLTLAGLGVCAGVYAVFAGGAVSARLADASFITLSVLTAPHMLVPLIGRAVVRFAPSVAPSVASPLRASLRAGEA